MYTGQGKSYTDMYNFEDAAVPYHFMVSLRRKHLINIHGFDEDFYGRMASGDDDIAGRLRRLRLLFKWDPAIVAIHQFHKCPENLTKGMARVNIKYSSGQQCCRVKADGDIVRNKNNMWGRYPRHKEDSK
ncbi:unnamed protein product [marine sediment metagenome]|uniref:Uncharacterized protein n=1 Tax=marine sediment metagenome TaxID=412755 RepID=X1DMM7_9ZZZZ